jgi:hypothetical protein
MINVAIDTNILVYAEDVHEKTKNVAALEILQRLPGETSLPLSIWRRPTASLSGTRRYWLLLPTPAAGCFCLKIFRKGFSGEESR